MAEPRLCWPTRCWPLLLTLYGWPSDPQTGERASPLAQGAARAAVWGSPLTGGRPVPLVDHSGVARPARRDLISGASARGHRDVAVTACPACSLFVESPPQAPSPLFSLKLIWGAFVGRCGPHSAHVHDCDELKGTKCPGCSRRLETVLEGESRVRTEPQVMSAPRWRIHAGQRLSPRGWLLAEGSHWAISRPSGQ